MQEFPQSIYPELDEFGAVRTLAGTLEEASYHVGSLELSTPQGIAYDVTLSNTGEAILLQGSVSAVCETECSRCLRPITIEVEGEAQGYYLLHAGEGADGFDDDEFEVVDASGNIDLSNAFLAALTVATPVVILHDEDCAGLCPRCGADLNDGPCNCTDEAVDDMNPFAALVGLQFSEEDVARGEAAAAESSEDAVEPADEDAELEASPEYQAALKEAVAAVFSEDEDADSSFEEGELDPYAQAAARMAAQQTGASE